jgi:hypothetical protein
VTDRPGGIFVRPADQIAEEDRILIQTVTHAAALPRGNALRHPARIRLQRLRAHRARHPLRAVGLRGSGRSDQVHGAQSAKRVGLIPPALRDRICGMGTRRPASEIEHARGHRN